MLKTRFSALVDNRIFSVTRIELNICCKLADGSEVGLEVVVGTLELGLRVGLIVG